MKTSTRSRMTSDDTGAALVFALIIITTVALVSGAILAHGGANFRATVTLRGVAGTSYAADAAAKVAINDLRLGADAPGWTAPSFPGVWDDWVYTNNADGTGCFGAVGTAPDNTLELGAIQPAAGRQTAATSARVECTAVPGTGIFAPGEGVDVGDEPDETDAFARALTTIGTSGAWQGMTLKPLGTGNEAPMPMRGGVASKSYIDVNNGALVTNGYAKAEGACTGTIISTPAARCNAAGTVPVPNTPTSPLSSVPTWRDPMDYTGSCTFPAGFYNNAARLTSAVNSCNPAKFASGDYYFDFVDAEHGAEDEWMINTTVVGGVYVGTSIPGACKSPIQYDGISGVRFVFGGDSRITVRDGAHVELCGPENGGAAPLTVYQQPTGSTPAAASLSDRAPGTVNEKTGNSGGDKWTTSVRTPLGTALNAAVAAADSSSLTWTIAANNDDIGLDLQDFAGLSGIAAGSDISSAQLRVKYAKTSTRSLTATVNGQTPASVALSAPDGSGWGSVDLASQLRSALQDGPFTSSTPVIELRLMNAAKNDTLSIDAIQISVTSTPPALRAASDVVIIGLDSGSNFAGEFVVQGSAWTPKGYIDLDPGSDDQALVAFRWGIVALGVAFKAQPPQQFGYPLVSIPEPGKGLGSRVSVVDLKVFVCVEQATCSSGGAHALTSRVMITDPPYGGSGAPVPGQRQVKVLSWAEQK